ncbi:MAG: hypothetical protein ACP59X_18730 [Solidesulfovibrio sp. DCME]|uniref:hypothetical protein n=1 Tax=Solidesulfovibrio sp. DCME TaxID=3447380 RepID=UPI003D0B80EC
MKCFSVLQRRLLVLTLAAIASLAAYGWHEYTALQRDYKRAVAAGATTPDPGGPPGPSFDAYHNAVALGFRDALRGGRVEAFFCNDSVMGGHTDDEARTTIAAMLGPAVGLDIYPVSGAGYAAVLYREYAGLAATAAKKPRLAIIGVNLRSFSDDWLFTPRWVYAATAAYLRLLAAPPTPADLPGWLGRGKADPDAFWRQRTDRPQAGHEALFARLNAGRDALLAAAPPGLSPDEAGRRTHFINNYMTQITPDHPMLAALSETAQRLARAGVPTVFYLTPIDVEGGRQLVGEALVANVAANSQCIAETLRGQGATCLDLSALLPTDRFVDREYACEHLDLAGRRRVAEALAQALAPTP